jgi:uncharacterized Zn-binding protein involved in type VI secretion
MRPFIRVGDSTDHGGVVVGGASSDMFEGQPVARVSDSVTCPKHGPTTIVSGDATMLVDGKAVARHGDKCACGATLMASQSVSGTE